MAKLLRRFITLVVVSYFIISNVYANEDATTIETAQPSIENKLTDFVKTLKQQASATLDSVENTVLNKIPAQVTDNLRNTENKLIGDEALDRLESSKRDTITKAKQLLNDAMLKLKNTVEELKMKHAQAEEDVSSTLDNIFEKIETDGKAAFDYTSSVLSETAEKAKAAVEKSQRDNGQTST
ncbi:uncharacterized protein LOC126895204 [Daktulosphaira vitifoliae]|uniref:uncharacterized protein LOC126895204 n=1 Tax=Daktulosphaira vitifoliae TaxID=58002 RepID=UPI0021AA9140|nr:uncharacterized protein LOC126895204 [Daktulosphaira vitifoliae]